MHPLGEALKKLPRNPDKQGRYLLLRHRYHEALVRPAERSPELPTSFHQAPSFVDNNICIATWRNARPCHMDLTYFIFP